MIDKRPFDLARIDTEGLRKRQRKRLLLLPLPVCVVLLFVALWASALQLSSSLGGQTYKDGAYTAAVGHFERFLWANIYQPYKMQFNHGTALLAAKDYERAYASLEKAMDSNVPPSFECQVRVNLVLAINGRAEIKMSQKKYDDAIILYDDAKSVIDGRDCGLKSGKDTSSEDTKQANQTLQSLREQLTSKQNEAKQQRNGDKPNTQKGDEGDSAKDTSTPDSTQLQTLQQQQDTNTQNLYKRRVQSRSSEADRKSSYNKRSYKEKNW